MNKLKLVGMWAVAAAALVVAGCSDGSLTSSSKGQGRISPAVDVNRSILSARDAADAPSRKSRAEAEDVSDADLQLTIKSADGAISKSWASLADYDNPEFPVGIYTVAASYGTEDSEGFEAPYYYGEAQVRVRDGETTSTGVTASLANCRFAFSYTDAFTGYIADWSAEVHSSGGNYFTVAKDETRPVYVRPGYVRISVHIVKPNGKEATVEVATVNAAARRHYNVTIDMNNGQGAGEPLLVVEFDESLETEPVEIELSDELFNVAAPEVTPVGFTSGEAIKHIIGEPCNETLSLDIMARAGLKAVTLTSKAPTLVAAGWPAEIDLMQASAAQQAAMQALGFKVTGLWKNPDKMAMVDFSAVIPNIKEASSGATLNEFTITVTDANGRVSQPVTLAVDVRKLHLTLSDPSMLLFGATTMQWTVGYNGSNLQDNVKIQYLNELGNWSDCEITAVEANGEDTYRVTINVPDSSSDHVFRAAGSGLTTEEVTVTVGVPEYTISVDDRNVFANRATIAVECPGSEAADVAAAMRLEVSTDGGNTYAPVSRKNSRASSSAVTLSALQPGTNYTVRASIGSVVHTATFTTEAAAQIPNGNLDADVSFDGNGNNWENVVFQGWGTNNAMTTSQGGDLGYTRISGTIQTDDSHSGKAALIRNVGWGSGNTATGSKGTSGKCKYTDVGLLHLGSTRVSRPAGYGDNDYKSNNASTGPLITDDLNCGIDFSSRPVSISFWYKYSPKNSGDKGYAEIVMTAVDGTVLAKFNTDLSATNSYMQKSFDFSYPQGAPKAAKLYVKFLSSNDIEYFKRTDSNFSGPGFANLGRGAFMGSQLYIDDIELTY